MNKLLLTSVALVALVLFTAPASAADAPRFRYIKDDFGGRLVDYIRKAEDFKKKGIQLRISGVCASACVVLLHEDFDLDVCAEKNAKIAFHMPYTLRPMGHPDRNPAHVAQMEDVAEYIVSGLPPALQEAFAVDTLPSVYKGDDPDEMVWVSKEKAQAAIGACPPRKGLFN